MNDQTTTTDPAAEEGAQGSEAPAEASTTLDNSPKNGESSQSGSDEDSGSDEEGEGEGAAGYEGLGNGQGGTPEASTDPEVTETSPASEEGGGSQSSEADQAPVAEKPKDNHPLATDFGDGVDEEKLPSLPHGVETCITRDGGLAVKFDKPGWKTFTEAELVALLVELTSKFNLKVEQRPAELAAAKKAQTQR